MTSRTIIPQVRIYGGMFTYTLLAALGLIINVPSSAEARQDVPNHILHSQYSEPRSHLIHLDVVCGKDHMAVSMQFDHPFQGLVSSHTASHHQRCVHVRPRSGVKEVTFRIPYNGCGTIEDVQGRFYENTVVVQFEVDILEAWDEAKRLRCEWLSNYEKPSAKPTLHISELDVVELNFQGDDVECWMEIQEGKGPWGRKAESLVPIGSPLTLVIAINDHNREFDMRVKRCDASDGGGSLIHLTDERGCVLRKTLLTPFLKVRDFGGKATLLAYAHFYAFKFPDNLDVYVRCTVEVCRHGCLEPCSSRQTYILKPNPRDPQQNFETPDANKESLKQSFLKIGEKYHSEEVYHDSYNEHPETYSHPGKIKDDEKTEFQPQRDILLKTKEETDKLRYGYKVNGIQNSSFYQNDFPLYNSYPKFQVATESSPISYISVEKHHSNEIIESAPIPEPEPFLQAHNSLQHQNGFIHQKEIYWEPSHSQEAPNRFEDRIINGKHFDHIQVEEDTEPLPEPEPVSKVWSSFDTPQPAVLKEYQANGEVVVRYNPPPPVTEPQPFYVPKPQIYNQNLSSPMQGMKMQNMNMPYYPPSYIPRMTTSNYMKPRQHHYPYPIPQFSSMQQMMMMGVVSDRRMDADVGELQMEDRPPIRGFFMPQFDGEVDKEKQSPIKMHRIPHGPRILRVRRAEPVFGVQQKFRVISLADVAFELNTTADNAEIFRGRREDIIYGICMSKHGLSAGISVLLLLTTGSMIVATILYHKHQVLLNAKKSSVSTLSRIFNGRLEHLYTPSSSRSYNSPRIVEIR